MQSPIDWFFKLGEKVTRGDPERQQDFVYYMVWILFIAFSWLFFYNLYDLVFNQNLNAATWTLVGFAICGIQFFSLKGMYDGKQMRKKAKIGIKEVNIDSVSEMMDGFEDEKKDTSSTKGKSKLQSKK